jgi:outer membrane protein assembly factor BamA
MLSIILVVLGLQFQAPESLGQGGMNVIPEAGFSKQDSVREYVQIGRIVVIGNDRTRKAVILREMNVSPGDVFDVEELELALQEDRMRINNTRLFHTVKVTLLPISMGIAEVLVEVSERWYFFPVPIFELVDRNFNDWWTNRNRDLSRTNYGVKLYQNNTRGLNDQLAVTLQFGFTKQFGINYNLPYIDKSKRHGISINADYSENKNVAWRTVDHIPEFVESDNTLRIRRRFGLGYQFRNSFYVTHSASVSYHNNTIGDTLMMLNPTYFQNGEQRQEFFRLSYTLRVDRRDYTGYALRGHWLEGTISQSGVGIYGDVDKTEIYLRMARYMDLGSNYFLSNYTSALLTTPNEQPYSNFSALGYRTDLIRGYELYLIEGQHYLLNRTTFKKQIVSTKFYVKQIPVEQFRHIPLSIFLKTYFDMGYVQNLDQYEESGMNTQLANRFLFGTGMGLDIVTAYDMVIRLEYSLNREKETGFFLHFRREF